jgi:hypothetical protein
MEPYPDPLSEAMMREAGVKFEVLDYPQAGRK